MNQKKLESLGLGLRFPHFDDILGSKPQTPWFEVMTDDFLSDGPHHKKLEKLREEFPINLHSIGLNIGGVDDFDKSYLKRFKELYEKFQPEYISDHLCWSNHGGKYHHDLLPVIRNKESLDLIVMRIQFLQEYFKRPLLMENITSYIDYEESDYSETDFINEICKKTDCYLLLDISNVIINAKNRKESPLSFLENYPLERVRQGHLAGGFESRDDLIIDTHGSEIQFEDIKLLKEIYSKGFNFPVIIERDANLPPFNELEQERKKVEGLLHE